MGTITSNTKKFAVVGSGVVSTLALLLSPVAAMATNPTLWNSSGRVAMRGLPSTQPGVQVTSWEPNNIRIQMDCWLDNAGYRWIRGTAWDGNYGYVMTRDIRNQIRTPHC